MEVDESGPIFTQQNTARSLGLRYIYFRPCMKIVVAVLHIYGDGAIFIFFVITKALNIIHEKCIFV